MVKFVLRMNPSESQVVPSPPSLIKALTAGFDTISNHVGLIIFTISLDLLLWLGPRLRVVQLTRSILDQTAALSEFQDPDMADRLLSAVESLNLLSVLRTFPVGIPSLMAARSPTESPLGQPLAWEIPTVSTAFGLWLVLVLLGLTAGSLYFTVVQQAALAGKVTWRQALTRWPWACLNVLLLTILWLVLLIAVTIPFSCFLSTLLFSGIDLGQISIFLLLIFGGLLVWLLLPLIFSPHGIFVNQRVFWASISDSVRITRMTLPSTSLLFLVIIILSEGLSLLWMTPAETSWLALIGIAGHAFITTSLLAASFVYYRDAHRWVQRRLQQAKLSIA